MTEVQMEDGSKMETNLPAETVADLQAKEPEKAAEPAKVEEPAKPAAEPKAEEPKEPAKEPEKAPEGEPKVERTKKATPFQTLLDKKHEAEEAVKTEKARADLAEAKLQELAAGKNAPVDVKQLVEQLSTLQSDEERIAAIVDFARKGFKTELPKEVQDMLAEQKASKEQAAETTAFNKRVDSLATTLKDDQLKDPSVREKLMKLAYSTEKAPDGEPYYQKELAELYFGFVKPQVEPGKDSAESSRGGSQAAGKVVDFAEIKADPEKLDEFARTATKDQFKAFEKWDRTTSGDIPFRKPATV